MTIYAGDLKQDLVKASVQGTEKAQDVGVGTGTLTIRGTKDKTATVAVNDKENNADGFTVTAAEDNAYYVNGSPIQVQDKNTVHLLVDELAMEADSDTEDAMQGAALAALGTEHGLTDPQYDFKYLDLVDNSNGNAYVTLNQDDEEEEDVVTIHWPMPANADPDTIHVVHFDGLDRDYDVTDLDDLLNNPKNPDKVQVITGAYKDTVGEVTAVFPKENRIIVEGVNIVKKHMKPTQQNPDGGIMEKEAKIHISNVMLYDEKAKKAGRVGFRLETDKKGNTVKVRVNKKTGAVIKDKK